jgi:hypothetical protein
MYPPRSTIKQLCERFLLGTKSGYEGFRLCLCLRRSPPAASSPRGFQGLVRLFDCDHVTAADIKVLGDEPHA